MIPINHSVGATQVSQALVAITDNHEKNPAAYQVTFRTSALAGSQLAQGDSIFLKFPAAIQVPNTIAGNRIKVNDVTLSTGASIAITTDGNSDKTIQIPLPQGITIPSNGFVKVEIAQEAGIRNPNTSGTYVLEVRTSKDTQWVVTNEIAILNSMVSIPEITVAPNIVGETGAYFIRFRVSAEGALNKNGASDEIYIEFPTGTTFTSNTIASHLIKVNEQNISTTATVNGNVLTVRVPTQVTEGEEVRLSILKEAGIIHPASSGNYTLFVSTSRDSEKNMSTSYTIETSLKSLEAWVSPNVVAQPAQYTVGLTNSINPLMSCTDSITIRFPVGTVFPSSLNANYVYMNGEAISGKCGSTSLLTLNASQRTITILVPQTIGANEYVSFILDSRLGITNPQLTGNYQLEVRSSQELAYRPSPVYALTGNAISPLTVQVLESGVGKAAEYFIQFSTSTSGGLIGGQDRIFVSLPQGTQFPSSSIGSQHILINDKALSTNVSVSNNQLSIQLPSSLQIPVNSSGKQDVTVKILPSSGIRNPSTPGEYSLFVSTSRDQALVKNTYTIGKQVDTPSVSLSPNQFNQNGQYSIVFKLSDIGKLEGGKVEGGIEHHIELLFPNGTFVPGSISPSHIFVNGTQAKSVSVSGRSVKVYLAQGMVLDHSSSVGLIIQATAGIRNPSAGSHQLKVRTAKDQSYVNSHSYSTTGAAITNPPTNPGTGNPGAIVGNRINLQLSSYEANAASQYTITYTTASNESLVGGTDDISILFHSNVQMPTFISRELIKVNNVAVDTGVVRIQNNIMTFRMPSNVNVGAGQAMTITIDTTAQIRNPSLNGSYLMYAWSTKNTTSGYVNYNIVNQTNQSLLIVPTYDQHNKIYYYTLRYTNNSNDFLLGGSDWISIIAPTTLQQDTFKENVSISVGGALVGKNSIQVSGTDFSFTLPQNVNVGINQEVLITIDDPKQLLSPPITGKYKFLLATSKQRTRISSNDIEYRIAGSGNVDQGSGIGNPTPNPINPGGPDFGRKTIQLTINQTTAFVNNQAIALDAAPTLINGTTLVPIRFISETIGATVNYRSDQKRIDIQMEDKFIALLLDSDMVYTSQGAIRLAAPAKVINGRTMVPLRFVSEQLGMYVAWDGSTQTIELKER